MSPSHIDNHVWRRFPHSRPTQLVLSNKVSSDQPQQPAQSELWCPAQFQTAPVPTEGLISWFAHSDLSQKVNTQPDTGSFMPGQSEKS